MTQEQPKHKHCIHYSFIEYCCLCAMAAGYVDVYNKDCDHD